MDHAEEARLLQSCRSGNLQDFAPLYDAYITPIYRFIAYRIRDRMLTEDLTSQTFLKALERIATFDPKRGTFSAWIYSIARNTVTDHFRTHHQHEVIDEEWDIPGGESATESTERALARREIRKALASLDPEKREILLLRLWDELSYEEIAVITGKSVGNCKVIVSRTLSQLRKDLPPTSLLLLLLFPFLS